ncbi:beta-aspartyl-peptidase [Sutterella megalosphaeroides]|uniref:Isoaspartyl dipeptidase n=1 Tax=Sutterella megalosphaeroides TaxID=2494234 RepID=A0A2Z6I9I1_9BURK|nr:beta-aspartyl-peptidase [Sutterella megalosphaeroides]BBF23105.1 isoaspartyl dipeptidase [Sutterella megalosphaeroides]
MQNPMLLKNCDLWAPEHLGRRDVFVAGGKVVAVEPELSIDFPGLETIDMKGAKVVPGLIDQHIHVTGGGGEGGWQSRCPELVFSELVRAGVTTFLGVSGTDSMSRSIENLLAKVRGLAAEGASGWMWTSNYAYPPTTITRDVKTDLFAIPEVLGVKIALGDHRSSWPTKEELLRLASEVRIAGMLTGKVGFVHVHLGDHPTAFDLMEACIATGIPAKHFRPTHTGRHPEVFRRACEFAKAGGIIDITTGGGNYLGTAAETLRAALAAGVPAERITLSSDGHGSMPRFNDAGEMVGLAVGLINCNKETIGELAKDLGLEAALRFMTTNVAQALNLTEKGAIVPGADADLLVVDDAFEPQWVFMRGRIAMREGELLMKGTFED